jgi:hypothetical protein
MDGGNEQRVAIKFRLKKKAYGNEALNQSNVPRFRDRRELVEDDKRGGCPKSTQTEVNIAAVANLVKNYHQITSRMIAESLNIPKTVVLRILKGDLGKRKLCACFFPHSLTFEQREVQVTSCQGIIAMAKADKNFFNKIIMGDETWCFAYDCAAKRQSFERVGETSPRPQKMKFHRSRHQDHVNNFFLNLKV